MQCRRTFGEKQEEKGKVKREKGKWRRKRQERHSRD
jgi:hypothetical protein